MDTVSAILFNTLARHGRINLPGIGSLRVTQTSVVRPHRTRLIPPINRVVFSTQELAGCESMKILIARETGCSAQEAAVQYEAWRNATLHENEITIPNTGIIRNGKFEPSSRLDSLLNPTGKQPVKLPYRRKHGVVITALSIATIAIAGGSYYYFGTTQDEVPENTTRLITQTVSSTPNPTKIDTATRAEAHTAQSDTLIRQTDTTIITSGDKKDQRSQSVQSPPYSDTTAIRMAETSRRGIFHIVAGVFSTEENANRFIEAQKQIADTVPYAKVYMPNGKIIVSIYRSDSEQRASHRLQQLLKTSPDLWIYREKNPTH